jgi:hypothetical protein
MEQLDYPAAHADAFQRLVRRFGNLDDMKGEIEVPACPHWSVLDVARHRTGSAVDCSGEKLPNPEDWEEAVMDSRPVARSGRRPHIPSRAMLSF